MIRFLKRAILGTITSLIPIAGFAHTNSVGFKISPSAVTTCVGGPATPCYDVEIFYGTWHAGVIPAEGDLALWRQDNPGETQVVGQSAIGGSQIPFSSSHSLTGSIPNSSAVLTYNYSAVPSADFSALAAAFSLGTDYFFHTGSGLGSAPDGSTNGLYGHQSAVAVGLAPGTYRIAYDAATSGSLTANWQPTSSIQTAIFTVTAGGGVVVPSAPPSVVLSTPTATYSGPFTTTVTFSEPITGLTLSDFVVGNGSASNLVMVSPDVYTILVTPSGTSGAVTVDLPTSTVIDATSDPNVASNQLVLNAAPPPLTPFTPAVKEELRRLIVGEAAKDLGAQMAANQRFTRGARDRMLATRRCRQLEEERRSSGNTAIEFVPECDDDLVSRHNVPFDFSGSLVASSKNIDLTGQFFGQNGNYEGTLRRLVYGEFDLTRYDNGSVLGTLSGRAAWEKMVSDTAMLGYFVGADISRSDIKSSFSGSRDTIGLSLGAYFVQEINENLVGDAFLSVGAGMNNLDVGDGTIDVTGDYVTSSIQVGAAISGEIEYEKFTISPEFSGVYGITEIGDVDVKGSTITVSGTDTIAAGSIYVSVLKFTPRFEIPLTMTQGVYDEKQLTIAPSFLCQSVRDTSSDSSCGSGLELELVANTYDNTKRIGARVGYQSVGGEGRQNLNLFYEHSF